MVLHFLLAAPLSYYFMDNWLQSFAYKIILSEQIPLFITSIIAAFIVTMATVGYHTMRAATANPVKALREE